MRSLLTAASIGLVRESLASERSQKPRPNDLLVGVLGMLAEPAERSEPQVLGDAALCEFPKMIQELQRRLSPVKLTRTGSLDDQW